MLTESAKFLSALADLMEQYRAGLSYSVDDDGIHIEIDGREVFVGFLDDEYGVRELREAAAA